MTTGIYSSQARAESLYSFVHLRKTGINVFASAVRPRCLLSCTNNSHICWRLRNGSSVQSVCLRLGSQVFLHRWVTTHHITHP